MLLVSMKGVIFSQSVSPNEKRHFGYGYNTIYETKLFDTKEIRIKGFKTAYLIYHSSNWIFGEKYSNDTILFYHFDTLGLIKMQSYKDTTGEVTTTFFDTSQNLSRILRTNNSGKTLQDDKIVNSVDTTKKLKVNYNKTKDGLDSVYTNLMLEQVGSEFDTLYYTRIVKDKKGNLKEEIKFTSKRLASKYHILHSKTHYQYEYDNDGQLVLKKDLINFKAYKTTYSQDCEVYQTFNSKNNNLLNAEVKFKNEDNIITLTTKKKHVIISPLEKDSKLVKLLTVIVTDEFPTVEYYEIIYNK